MAQAYRYTFTAKGKTPFPMEMLTHDQCYPYSKQDAAFLSKKKEEPVTYPLLEDNSPEEPSTTIELATTSIDPNWQPSIAHWNKQGWSIGTIRRT